MTLSHRGLSVVVAAALLIQLAGLAPARACENEVELATNRRVQLLVKAEKDLDEGRFTLAAQAVAREYPALREATLGKNGLWDRSTRIVALAISRTKGAVKAYGFVARDAAERTANVTWAIGALRAIVELRKDDPAMLTDLGEARARDPGSREEALRLLGGLGAKDLVTTARGYRALAALRDRAGDSTARDAALARSLQGHGEGSRSMSHRRRTVGVVRSSS